MAAYTAEAIIDILKNIAYYSGTQEQLTTNLTILRNAAVRAGKKELFDRCLQTAKNGGIAPEDMNGCEWRFRYNAEDFGSSEEPYREVFFQPTAFLKQRTLDRLAVEANKCGFKGFKATYKAFEQSMRQVNSGSAAMINPTDFPQQPMELECGVWHCDSTGVSKVLKERVEYACLHPVMPIERLVNIDTGEEKLRIAFYKGRYWRDFIASKRDLFDSAKIIQFSGLGVSVTSKSAKLLAEYLCDIETLNPGIIPETESVARLGYIGDGGQFSPYVENLVFDGDANYHTMYNAITEHGSYEKWLENALECRNDSLTAQIMLAASFASVLIRRIGGLPFFVHLWGGSETGKTVALMNAATVWGDPEIGKYIQTFNSTDVGSEKTAAFLNNIPMCIDETQLIPRDSHGNLKFSVYKLAQGVGRTRGTKTGGIERTPTWSLCVLSTGETGIVNNGAGEGAINRVIEIDCSIGGKVIKDGKAMSRRLKKDYGFAGKMFIKALEKLDNDELYNIYDSYYSELQAFDVTDKQSMAAAMILTADELADKFILKTGKHLKAKDIAEFLKTKASVSLGERGYAYMCDWVALNANKFKFSNEATDIYGVIENDWAYINRAVFRKVSSEAGYDDKALLAWLKHEGLIQTRGKRFTRGKRLNGVNTECVVMKLPDSSCETDDYEDLL